MIITEQEKLNNLVFHAYHRELEINGYQVNIDNYTMMLATLPTGDWPESISQYRNTPIAELPHSLTDEEVQLATDYNYRDYLRNILRTEKAEQSKSIRLLDVMKTQIGQDYSTLVQAFKATQV